MTAGVSPFAALCFPVVALLPPSTVSHSVTDMLEISIGAWFSFVIILVVFLGIRAIPYPEDHSIHYFSLVMGWSLHFGDLGLYLALKRAQRVVLRRAGVRKRT